ncbi:TonB-dependent receptor [Pseudidiomarina salinarum]|uniref:TonB-dependent receptor n=1 Tax=Pseudidiomarina salinarum TaxID=435908 RepID=UPI000B299F78|nr:TonB-dependent receptor [Pseudidiomarina salinarum]RUO70281.1 TonB-dependent receptor [Pseudidiomarina salinarum]
MFRVRSSRLVFASLFAVPLVSAATAQEPPTADSAVGQDIEVIEVTGERRSVTGLSPKNNPVDGVFGGDKVLADIPRSVTPISSQLLEAAAINDLHDISKVAPNTYSAAGFGAPSLPTIRGQLGEIFQLGMRRQGGNNGLGIPLSFNSVAQVDVVRGVAPVILGSTQRTGGFVNLQPKQAQLQETDNIVQLSAGRWQQYRAQVDMNQVLDNGKQALRASVEVVREDSFYDYAGYDSDNIYLAWRWLPDASSELNLHAEFYDVDWTDNAGLNRPTQDLIDHGWYVQGQGVQPNGSTVPGAFAVVSPTGQVKIPRSQVYTDPLDINNAQTYLLFGDYQRDLGDGWEFTQTAYFQHLEREEIAQNSFVEIIDGATTFETRSTWQREWAPGQVSWFGGNLRYNDVLGFSQFTTEADLPVDLTGPLSNRRIPLTAAQKARLVELRPDVWVSPGTQYDIDGDGAGDFNLSDTTDSTSYQLGVFVQHEQPLSVDWLLQVGLRADWYDVTARDPIAPAGVTPAEDSHSEWLYGAQASLSYSLNPDSTFYLSTNYTESTSNSMAGGTVLGADQQINPLNFATENEAVELGYKYAPANSPWYLDAAVFEQTRSLRNRDGSNSGIKNRGFESQLFYTQDALWLSLGYTYLDARYDESASFQDSRQVYDAFDNSRPDIVQGTGVGAPNFAFFPASSARAQGQPDHTAAMALGYQLSEAWEVGGQLSYSGDYKLDYLNKVRIREQHTLNLFAQFLLNNDRTRIRLDVFNVTDQDNWSPVFEGGYFGSTLVFPELPRHFEVTLTQRF